MSEPTDFEQLKIPEEKLRAEKTPESLELSPEQIEKIMEMVQDINTYGTAWRVTHHDYPLPQLENGENKLTSIFQNGLIGTTSDQPGVVRRDFYNQTNKDAYKKLIKERKSPDVWFSIVGRAWWDQTR